MLDRSEISKRGYLKEDFRLFHLKDSRAQKVDYHYHAFDKLILLLGGKVTYVVEGVTYFLRPWDMLLVGHDLIHRPIIDPAEPYERVVVWLGREWLERRSDPGEALSACFDTTRQRGFHLLRFDPERRLHYMQRIQQLACIMAAVCWAIWRMRSSTRSRVRGEALRMVPFRVASSGITLKVPRPASTLAMVMTTLS